MFSPWPTTSSSSPCCSDFGAIASDTPTNRRRMAAHRQLVLCSVSGPRSGSCCRPAARPSLRRAGLRLRLGPTSATKQCARSLRLSGWTFGLVVANQVALLVVLTLAGHVGSGAVSAYTYAYGPSSSSPTASWPCRSWRRSRRSSPRYGPGATRWPSGGGWPRDCGRPRLHRAGCRRSCSSWPRPLVALLSATAGHRRGGDHAHGHGPGPVGPRIPGFCVFLYAIRVLQSVQDMRSAFWLYVVENGVNIVRPSPWSGLLGVRGIALSISIAYTVAAVAALAHLRTRVHGLDADLIVPSSGPRRSGHRRAGGRGARQQHLGLAERWAGSCCGRGHGAVAGAAAYVLAAGLLARSPPLPAEHRTRDPPPPGNPPARGRRGRPAGPAPPAPLPPGPGAPADRPPVSDRRNSHSRVPRTMADSTLRRTRASDAGAHRRHDRREDDGQDPGGHRQRLRPDPVDGRRARRPGGALVHPFRPRGARRPRRAVDQGVLGPGHHRPAHARDGGAVARSRSSQAFTDAAEAGADGVVCINLSSGLSATYQSATHRGRGGLPIPVEVVDSRRVTMGLGLMVLAASDMAREGASLDEIVTELEDAPRPDTRLRRGRQPGFPEEGRPHRRAPPTSWDHCCRSSPSSRSGAAWWRSSPSSAPVPARFNTWPGRRWRPVHSNAWRWPMAWPGTSTRSSSILDGAHPEHEIVLSDLGPVIGAHAGPGSVGVCFQVAR